jgi:D-alanyl-D-alanine carboxypeptidase/D-alanyl-D-alanine-endopeptidase (penicillin-binding protein 4)
MAVKVASLDTGRTLYEENSEKLLHPASNMKIYTVAAALDRLTPDFRFKTSAYVPAMPDATGTVRGDLIIYGRGDPTFAASFNNGDYYKAIDDFAARIAAATRVILRAGDWATAGSGMISSGTTARKCLP